MRRPPCLALLLLAACSGGGGGSSTSTPSPPTPSTADEVPVSGVTPFTAGCGNPAAGLFVNAEVEPHLAVDPRDANHLVATWQQDRWSSGSARGNLVAASFDGGNTWSVSSLAFSVCAGGTAAKGSDYLRATDPWVAFGADGTVHAIGLATSGASFSPGSVSAVLASRSSDGGRTWSDAITVARDVGALFNDKETVTADPLDGRLVYAAWDRVDAQSSGASVFARSTDGGATWEASRAIYDPGGGAQTIGNLIRVLPDGTLVDLYVHLVGDENRITASSVEVIRSTDRGLTWSAPIVVSAYRALGASDPVTGRGIRDGSVLAQMAVAPDGSLDVVWQDARFTGTHDAVALSRSTDGGLTWSQPVRVNADASRTAFTPQVHVRSDGTIGVTYYVLAGDASSTGIPVQRRLARSIDGTTWSETAAGSAFDLSSAPFAAGQYFLGDYMGLASAGGTFLSLHARTTGAASNPTDIDLARVSATAKRAYVAQAMPATRRGADFERRVFEHLASAVASLRERAPVPERGRMR